MNQFSKEFNEANERLRERFKQVKYSAEYLDFKTNIDNMGDHAKKLFAEDMAGAGKNLGKMIKKFLTNEQFTQLINVKNK